MFGAQPPLEQLLQLLLELAFLHRFEVFVKLIAEYTGFLCGFRVGAVLQRAPGHVATSSVGRTVWHWTASHEVVVRDADLGFSRRHDGRVERLVGERALEFDVNFAGLVKDLVVCSVYFVYLRSEDER